MPNIILFGQPCRAKRKVGCPWLWLEDVIKDRLKGNQNFLERVMRDAFHRSEWRRSVRSCVGLSRQSTLFRLKISNLHLIWTKVIVVVLISMIREFSPSISTLPLHPCPIKIPMKKYIASSLSLNNLDIFYIYALLAKWDLSPSDVPSTTSFLS